MSVFHPIECDPKVTAQEVLYIRSTGVPDGDDQRLYDWGNFQIATSGFQGASVTIGELWVTYDIALIKPKAVSTTGSYILAARMQSGSAFGVTNAAPFAGAALINGSTLNLAISGGNRIIFDAGSGLQVGTRLKLDLYFSGTTAAACNSNAATLSGFSFVNGFNNSTGLRAVAPNTTVSATSCCWSYILQVTNVDTDPYFEMPVSGLSLPGGTITSDIYVVQLPASL